MADELDLLSRTVAGRYRIDREVGRGGMATVYLAHDLKHDRKVAVKVLDPELAASLGAERFLREIAITARLDHPHILPLLDSGNTSAETTKADAPSNDVRRGLLYYVMPYVEDESLRDRLARERQLPVADALRIAREVADALSYAHSRGIIHRDIKPENILLAGYASSATTNEWHARVADFGISRALTAAGGESITQTGVAVGTPTYMSPEQASGERDVDARSDVYSLGCVVYEMLAGEPPYTGATPTAILARKAVEAVPSVRVVRDTVPVAVDHAIVKALAKAPADRFASAAEFARALDARDAGVPSGIGSTGGARRSTRRISAILAIVTVAAALIIANLGTIRARLTGGAERPRIESLAVLPLDNLSNDVEQEYFAAGIHEALIIDLGKLSGLRRVSARPSVLQYRGTNKGPRQIADELGVDGLVTGTITRQGNMVRVTAQLIDPATGSNLWGEEYQREVRDVLALQDEIVGAIAREIQLQLSPLDRAELARARQVNPEAYEAYLKAKFQLNKFTAEGYEKGMALFRQAIEIDPTEPLAYAGLAQGYAMMEVLSASPAPSAVDLARAAAVKAVELDETLAEAHDALSAAKYGEWDWAGAEKSLLRAIELNPNLPEPRIHYGWHLLAFGRETEAVEQLQRAIALDPLSALYTAWLGGLYWEIGRFDEAIAEADKAMALQPDFPVALFVRGLAYADKGQYDQAIAAHERATSMYPQRNFTWALARTLAVAGRKADARAIMTKLESGGRPDALHPWFIAGAYVALGEHDKAIDRLERAYDARSFFVINLQRDRSAGLDLRPLRGHPRFQALLRRAKLGD